MPASLPARLWRLLTTNFEPQPKLRAFESRAQTQENAQVRVTVAVLDDREATHYFGAPLGRRGIQPVFLRIENLSRTALRLQLVHIDPNYFTPSEASAVNHFSVWKRLSAFGVIGWLILPLLALVPLKLITAMRANRKMDEFFQEHAFRLRPIAPGSTVEGFVFTPLDEGTKSVHVRLHVVEENFDAEELRARREAALENAPAGPELIDFAFSIAVPGIAADYLRRDLTEVHRNEPTVTCDLPELMRQLKQLPPATTNHSGRGHGDPVNLVVIGEFSALISSFAARWDESETITLATCWKTVKAFLLGTHYRYSPVSPLFLFNRSQDIALQRTRRSINERLHLRLWLTPMRFLDRPVWVGQVSRDIGVRFTTKVWNLTTHRVDPDVDEARDYVLEDLLQAERVEAAGYVDGVGACDPASPRCNLTGDPYFTDGKRAVALLSSKRTQPHFVAWQST